MQLDKILETVGCKPLGFKLEISKLNTLEFATNTELSFFENTKYEASLKNTNAKAVFIHPKYETLVPSHTIAIVTEEPYLMMARATKLFAKPESFETNNNTIHESATISEKAHISSNCTIGADVIIYPFAFIGNNVTIGDGSIIYPNATLHSDTIVGKGCIIQSGVVIGGDGFGFAKRKDGSYEKIYHLGNVILEDGVEIQSNAAIDKGVYGSTIIKKGAKLDNLIHVAHNCEIGANTVIAGQTGLAGSTKLGNFMTIGAQSGFAGHLSVGDYSGVYARGGVTKSLPSGAYAGFPAVEHRTWLKQQAMISKLSKK